ncbi:MAG TPA: polysaccharide biosynthesis/export family protein [Arsenicitalea sp.]|jgi:polysaccharide export outer membrane protein|nr:polysaccharide biosynthesis/export family protein [Arsenicitalea sp.]
MPSATVKAFAKPNRIALAAWCVAALALSGVSPAQADPYRLAPQTKLRLTVVQFMPTKGEFQRWDALGGDVVVSSEGSVLLPVLGSISVSNLDAGQLAAEIAKRLQAKIGLVDLPDTTVEVVEYPPVYLVGNVTRPGQYQFRPGMTVLQAVALAGGEFRSDNQGSQAETIRLQSDLQDVGDDLLRTSARIARLQAELSGAKQLELPTELTDASNDGSGSEIAQQEQTIFTARTNELSRQTTALAELGDLYLASIDVLQQKSQALDQQIAQSDKELEGVASLVQKGVATVSRRSDLERAIAGLRSDKLDNLIATMAARQQLNESKRNLAKLEDDRRTEVAQSLQTEQTNLERLKLKQTTSMRLLRQATSLIANDKLQEAIRAQGPVITIVRQVNGKSEETAAAETTALMPGDLVKVAVNVSAARAANPAPATGAQ